MELTSLLSVARHGLQFLGGLLVMHGYMEEAAVEFLVGGGANLAALLWFWHSSRTGKKGAQHGVAEAH